MRAPGLYSTLYVGASGITNIRFEMNLIVQTYLIAKEEKRVLKNKKN